ncbi:GNAT family N-acetyltransferase [Streptomyces sp. TG1A-60]|uniref:GNAT family N-acetyltransferase n=1 Tax=Streptomyces sp. TG1A-60 TaxID=3129111 RepID=UPI0030CF2654
MAVDLVRLQLDVTDFDLARFQPYVERCRTSGIRLTTLSELGDTPAHRRELYELNKECSADIPERGAFHDFDEYHRLRFEVPAYDPRGVVLAVDGDKWIGMAATPDRRRSGVVFNEMTGCGRPTGAGASR